MVKISKQKAIAPAGAKVVSLNDDSENELYLIDKPESTIIKQNAI